MGSWFSTSAAATDNFLGCGQSVGIGRGRDQGYDFTLLNLLYDLMPESSAGEKQPQQHSMNHAEPRDRWIDSCCTGPRFDRRNRTLHSQRLPVSRHGIARLYGRSSTAEEEEDVEESGG